MHGVGGEGECGAGGGAVGSDAGVGEGRRWIDQGG